MEMISKLAWRSIWRNKRRTILGIVSITFGLAAALFFITLSNGVYYKMIQEGTRMLAGHVTIEHPEYRDAPAVDLFVENSVEIRDQITELADIENVKLIVTGTGVARSGTGSVGIAFMGIEPSQEVETSPIAKKIVKGEFLDDEDERVVIVGSVLAKRLKLDIGKKMVLSTNGIDGNLVEELCRIKGIFKTGSDDIDGGYVLTPIGFARSLIQLPEDGATQIGIVVKKLEQMKPIQRKLQNEFKDRNVVVLNWKDVMPDLNAYIQLDRGANLIFQGIIIGLVLFTIFNTILMSVIERKREFAVSLALGTSPNSLQAQVFMESIYLGLIGVFFGTVVGGLIAWYYQVYGLDFSQLMSDEVTVSGLAIEPIFYARATPGIFVACGLIVFFSTILLSLIPMRRAANTPFSDVLR